MIKSWSTNQAVIALSSGEAECYGLVKGASAALGVRAISADMGVEFEEPITIKSDASAAIGIGNRVGTGKIRHIEVTQLWLQEKVSNRDIRVEKVPSEENLADALTKGVDAAAIAKHLEGVGAQILCDRHNLAPIVEGRDEQSQL